MDILTLLIGLAIGTGLGAALCWALGKHASGEPPAVAAARQEAALARVRAEESAARGQLTAELAAATATADQLRERVAELQSLQEAARRRQEAEREASAIRTAHDNTVLQKLAPVSESLQQLRRTFSDLEQQRATQHGELAEQLRTAARSEERLRSTTESLAAALKSNSTRGVWGETQLRSVVEAAGLIERVDFDVQSSISSDAGSGRPDMVVHLPGGKNIAVDSKVPFAAFLEASQIPATATGAEAARRDALLARHVGAVRDHVTSLGSKAYWQGLESSPELVIAFIPSEALVSAALEADPSLMEFAFGKRVALASPVTLWSVLKTVAFSWQQDVLTRDAKRLFDLSRELYSRLATTAGHIDKLGRSLKASVNDYNRFVGSLERQVLPSARRLQQLDEAKVIPALDGIDEVPRPLSAYELVSDPPEVAAELTPTSPAGDPR